MRSREYNPVAYATGEEHSVYEDFHPNTAVVLSTMDCEFAHCDPLVTNSLSVSVFDSLQSSRSYLDLKSLAGLRYEVSAFQLLGKHFGQ